MEGAREMKTYRIETIHSPHGGRFAVTYGQQVTRGLSYADAAREFGLYVFHGLACEGLIDNSEEK
jgi:hypothetical protein